MQSVLKPFFWTILITTSSLILGTGKRIVHRLQPVAGEFQYKNTAVGYTDSKGNSAVPEVTITDPHVKSVWLIQGCGKINHTWLKGPGGEYLINQGEANVQPGKYYLQIDGKAYITSGLNCQYSKIQITLYYN